MNNKKCTKCGENLPVSEFWNDKTKKGGKRSFCKTCDANRNKEYKRTIDGFIAKTYSDQKGRSKKRGDPAPSYSKSQLKEWLLIQPNFNQLWESWKLSGYSKDEAPSCDRLNDNLGYSLENIQLTTWKENNAKGRIDTINGLNTKRSKKVLQIDRSDGSLISTHHSCNAAARSLGKPDAKSNISSCCLMKVKSAYGYIWKYEEQ